MKSFLTAEWKNLINITYDVDPELLQPYLPNGLSLHLIEGRAFVSLVAFEFNNIKIKGMTIPFHKNFPEINLRFYVNKNGKRGVVFIKEFVPKYFVALVANSIYSEPYKAIPMTVTTKENQQEMVVEHHLSFINKSHCISVRAAKNEWIPDSESIEHFFKEHETGFGKDKRGNTLAYMVSHPQWTVYPIIECKLVFDFASIYGEQWRFLNEQKPYNTLMAKGSQVVVYDKEIK